MQLGWILCFVWTAVIALLLWHEIQHHQQVVFKFAAIEARATFNKDLVYRRWTAMHGGAYVPSTLQTPPNPYLSHIKDRDIVTPSGKQLTLVNPAYLTRQVHEIAQEQYGVKGHITSLFPLRPENKPDPWEKKALEAFENGKIEIQEIQEISGIRYLRLMRPMVTEEACLKCHAHQGYQVGQIRGGISVSVPTAIYETVANENTEQAVLGYSFICILGIFCILAGARALNKQEIKRQTGLAILAKNEKKYRDIVTTTTDGFWHVDKVGRILLVNPAYCQMSGYTEKELLDMTVQDIEAAENQQEVSTHIQNVIAKGNDRFETRHRQKNESIIDVEISTTFLDDGQGGFITFIRDITQRKNTDRLIRENEARYRTLLETIPISLMVVREHRFVYINTAGSKMLGYENPQNLMGTRAMEIVHPDDAQTIAFQVERLKQGKTTPALKIQLKKKDNTDVLVNSISISLIFDGKPAMLVIAIDMTEQQAMEAEKSDLEKQLIQLQKMEALGTLAGGIAHDFNNILFPIVGFAEMLKDDVEPDSTADTYVQEIITGAKRARDLVTQILTFSRQTDHENKPMQPHLIIKEVFKLIKSTLPSTIQIKQYIDTQTHAIMADPTQIHQIAMNLITNAFYAMEENGGTLSICLKNLEEPPSYPSFNLADGPLILFSVQDTGTGMNEATLAKIFNPYFTTREMGKGTGLGLSVVHGIVKNYGGGIQVISTPGQGTRFEVFLPAMPCDGEIESLVKSQNIPGGSEVILMVDDEPQITRLADVMLKRLGYKTSTWNSPLEALAQLKQYPHKYDLVITDMTMPEMTGDQLAGEIQSLNPDLPIIICTGYSEKISEKKAEKMGIKGLLMKPIVRSELARMIRDVLDKTKI